MRYEGISPGAGSADHDSGSPSLVVAHNLQMIPKVIYGSDQYRTLYRKCVARFVAFQILNNLITAWVSFLSGWHLPARERTPSGGRKETQTVPTMLPGPTGSFFGIQHHKRIVTASKVVGHRQCGLSATNNCNVRFTHHVVV